jgi:hypothetical protein
MAITKYEITVDDESGLIEYRCNGLLHRLNGPAQENKMTGYKAWFINGEEHDWETFVKLHKSIMLARFDGEW